MKDKNLLITFSITFVLFSFIIFLMYLIYCYSYYDNRQIELYLDNYNSNSWDYVYDHWYNNQEITKDQFYNSINIMYDQNLLRNIYDTYYKNNSKITFDVFNNQYYYGNSVIEKKNVLFETKGKTNLRNRKEFYFNKVNLENKYGYTTRLGIFKNIHILVPDGGSIIFDNEECVLNENVCTIPVLFGGLHKLLYNDNGAKYFTLINVYDDEMEFNVSNIENFVRYIGESQVKGAQVEKKENSFVNKGSYRVSACYLSSSCPNTRESYLILNEDGTCTLFIYITLDVSRDTYYGIYEINEDFIYLKFKSHVYNVFDYDTKEATDIEAETSMIMRFKIENANVISNEKYKFTYVG